MEISRRPVALVTGGSRGVGAASALALARRGYDIAITYRNKASRAYEVATEIGKHGTRALSTGCDITRQEDRERLFATLQAWTASLNVLVLNASAFHPLVQRGRIRDRKDQFHFR